MMKIHRERLLRRFLKYVTVDTTADDTTTRYPSSPGQLELGRLLVAELREIGVQDATQDEHGIVTASLGSFDDPGRPVVALNSHLDTSPETTGGNVRPQVIRDYQGGDIPLPGDSTKVISVKENPELDQLVHRTLITSDGTTLLGADDKAGVAIIMELAAQVMENPSVETAPLRLLFTCDEEIGRGVLHVDLEQLGATVAYTLDGPGADQIDVETFSADLATVRVKGKNIHPSIAKDRMVNALRAAGSLLAQLPRETLAPETTRDKDGFLHPYQLEGGVAEVVIRILLRDFRTSALNEQAQLLRAVADRVEAELPGARIDIQIQKQYRNLGDGLAREPRAVGYAQLAHQRLNRTARLSVIRGGTDGSLLTEMGLPTPNLSSGQHNPHSPLEWACLDEMAQATEVLWELVQLWAEK